VPRDPQRARFGSAPRDTCVWVMRARRTSASGRERARRTRDARGRARAAAGSARTAGGHSPRQLSSVGSSGGVTRTRNSSRAGRRRRGRWPSAARDLSITIGGNDRGGRKGRRRPREGRRVPLREGREKQNRMERTRTSVPAGNFPRPVWGPRGADTDRWSWSGPRPLAREGAA